MSERVLLHGVNGIFAAATFVLKRGQTVIVGRSRSCGFSACATPQGKARGRALLERSPSFLQISRRHFQVELTLDGALRLTNFSSNGLVVGEREVSEYECQLSELRRTPMRIKFGAEEMLEIRAEDSEVANAPK